MSRKKENKKRWWNQLETNNSIDCTFDSWQTNWNHHQNPKKCGGYKITSHYSSILYMKNLKKAMLIFGIVIVLISIIIKFV